MITDRSFSAIPVHRMVVVILAMYATVFLPVQGLWAKQTSSTPVVNIWYGSAQRAGHLGNPTRWINILGNVQDPDGIQSLQYTLNGGSPVALSIGPDGHRLLSAGDFNIDVHRKDLLHGNNAIAIRARDAAGNETLQNATLHYTGGTTWPADYSIDWSAVSGIQDVADISDGRWHIEGSTARTTLHGYDRLLGIGDTTWTDYEVQLPVTIHALDFSGGTGGYPAVGVLMRWNGHTDDPIAGKQPKTGWLPLGTIGQWNWTSSSSAQLGFYETTSAMNFLPALNTVYQFKIRVETKTNGPLYSLKAWNSSQPEPSAWMLTHQASTSSPAHGSFLLLAHKADVSFGNISVTSLSSQPKPAPPPETDGQPYAPDEYTAALYHFDGNFQDAGPNGLHLAVSGGAQTASDNLGWMTAPAGGVLRTRALGDQAVVSIPDQYVVPGSSGAPLTFEARFYPRAYKAYGQNNYPVISLFQGWDAMLEVKDGKWNNPAVPHAQAGPNILVPPGVWESLVALHTWHHLRMTLDASGHAEVYIDGALAGQGDLAFNYGRSGDWQFTLGNFDGDIDEVRISNVVRPGFGESEDTTPPGTPANLTATPVDTSRIDLQWTAATDAESGISGYRIYRDNVQVGNTAATNYTDSGLNPGTTYAYAVSAVNGAGLEGARSTPVSATTPGGSAPPGPGWDPYSMDANVIALYHFDGDYRDAGPRGLHLSVSGGAQLTADNLGWMSEPAGRVLRTRALGDQVSVTIPDNLLLPGSSLSPLTIDVMLHPRAYKAYSIRDARVVSLFQAFDTKLEALDGKWNEPAVPHVLAGNQVVVPAALWAANVSPATWHHLRITLGADGIVRVAVNGAVIAQRSVSLKARRSAVWTFTLGNFDGDIDEVRISNSVRTDGASLARPVAAGFVSETADDAAVPHSFALAQNFPNPFNPRTTIEYTLPEQSQVRMSVYNLLGQEVRKLVDGIQAVGSHRVVWDGRNETGHIVSSGVYIYRIETGTQAAARKMVLMQ